MTQQPKNVLAKAWWSNATSQFGVPFGIQYAGGDRVTSGYGTSHEEAQQKATDLAVQLGGAEVVCWDDLTRARQRRNHAEAVALARDLNSAQVEAFEHMEQVVSGSITEPPFSMTDAPDVTFCEDIVALPTLGGILSDLPLSAETERRFPEVVRLTVSSAAAKERRTWVVVPYQGRGVVMTIKEAYERGLKEANNWIPDLTGLPTCPWRSDFARVLG